MPNRIIKESICRSETVNALSWFEEVLFTRLIVACDDYGRFDGRPAIIKGFCFPLKDVTAKDIGKALNKLVAVGLVGVYEAQGQPVLQLSTWEKHQQIRAKKSKYPAPEETCNQMIANDSNRPRNPIQSESNPNPNPNRNTDAPVFDGVVCFEEFWAAYPSKQKRSMAEKAYCDVLLTGGYGEEELVGSAKNYAEYCELTGNDKLYHASNFLEKGVFKDYLPGHYVAPKKAEKEKKGFHNFEQRSYDFQELERKLMG